VSGNDINESDPLYKEFSLVFSKFTKPEELCKIPGEKDEFDKEKDHEATKNGVKMIDDQMNLDSLDGEKPLSKKKEKNDKESKCC